MKDGSGVPRRYRASVSSPVAAPGLEADRAIETVIVGTGITGLSAALTLLDAGRDVMLLEAGRVAEGSSGRSYGQIVPYSKHGHDWFIDRFGREDGERLIDMIAGGPDRIFGLIERYGIACDAQRNGMFVAAHHTPAEAKVRGLAAYWAARGAPVELLEGEALVAATGTRQYRVASLDRRAGAINVYAFVQGLARAVLAAGGLIHEGTRVSGVIKAEGGWEVRTPGGTIHARHVIVATNAYSASVLPALARSVLPLRGYQLLTKPLPEAERAAVLPGRQSLMDTRRLFSAIRILDDGRLHVSSDGPPFDVGASAFRAAALERVRQLFPQLGSVEVDEDWSGWVAIAPSQFPSIHTLGPGLWAALGYSGRGVAFGSLLGQEIARHVIGGRNDKPAFPVTPPVRIPSLTAARLYTRLLYAAYRVRDRRELTAERRSRQLAEPSR